MTKESKLAELLKILDSTKRDYAKLVYHVARMANLHSIAKAEKLTQDDVIKELEERIKVLEAEE